MNYKRIYEQFIADRFCKQPIKPQYFERHHIVPKSLGGDDKEYNIIKLTPEDHYFAHLCLAKIYGGSQWSSVLCMTKMLSSKKRSDKTSGFANRKMVAVARKKSALDKSLQYSGKLTRHTKKQYTLLHIDGKEESGSIVELAEKTQLSVPSVYRLVKRLQGMSYSGWYFDKLLMENAKQSKKLNGLKLVKNVCGLNKRKVICVETGILYDSIAQAEKLTGFQVGNYLYKNRNHVGGYTWEYA